MLLPYDGHIVRVIRTPRQRAIARLIIEETLVAETRVVCIGLIEDVRKRALGAGDDERLCGFASHFVIQSNGCGNGAAAKKL